MLHLQIKFDYKFDDGFLGECHRVNVIYPICTSWARTVRLRNVDLIITSPLSALLISIVPLSARGREILSLLGARSFTGRGEQWVNQSSRNQRLILWKSDVAVENRVKKKKRKKKRKCGGRLEIHRNKIKVRFVAAPSCWFNFADFSFVFVCRTIPYIYR